MQKLSRSLIAVAGLAALAACGDDVSVTAPPAAVVSGVEVSPTNLAMKVGETAQLGVSVTVTSGSGTPNTAVTWSSQTPAVATVSGTGLVTAAGVGSTTIRATSQADPAKSGAAQVVVTAPAVRSVTVSPAAVSIEVGKSVTAVATVDRDAGAAGTVTWNSTNTTIATVTSAGVITGVAVGTAVITATSTADNTKAGAVAVTVTPNAPAITAFSLTPTTLTMGPGSVQQVTSLVTAATGATVTYANNASAAASGCPGIATAATSAAGVTTVTAVASGTCVITVTATGSGAGLATASLSATIAINVLTAQISINSITTPAGAAVPVNNVAGQIQVNLNFQPSGLAIDSVVVRMNQPDGLRRVALQGFGGAVPAAGLLSLAVNTANFVKDPAAPSVTIDLLNGTTTVSAQVYPRNASGGSAVNCTNNPNDPTCAAPVALVLNNMDGWTADITKPSVSATSATGITYWGGPTANATGIVYPVIYTPGRSISTATWTIGAPGGGTCGTIATGALASSNSGRTQAGHTTTFGYPANGAVVGCMAYENLGGGAAIRDNILVTAATDNSANPYPLVNAATPLIPNTVVFNSTPDSLRLDFKAPTVSAPSIARALPAVTGWVDSSFNFLNFSSTDLGVGLRATRDRATFYNSVNCPTVTAAGVAMPNGKGADINGAVACPTNFIGGTPGLGTPGTAPWEVYGTESDRLGNVGTSPDSPTFGTDYTAPSIRRGIANAAFPLPAAYGGSITAPVDSTRFQTAVVKAPGVFGEFRAEYLDERSGFYNAGQPDATPIAAQTHFLAYAAHLQPTGTCQVGTNPVGATFVTNPTCGFTSITVGTPGVLSDGWQPGMRVNVPLPEGYYGYKTMVSDAAGNASATLFDRVLINNQSPFATGLGVPANLTATTFNFSATYADSAEIIAHSLEVQYPNLPTAPNARYNRASVGTAFDDVISSPLSLSNSPTSGAPYMRRIEIVNATVFPASNVEAAGVPVNVKPINAQAWSWNNGSTFGFGAGFPAPGASPVIPIPGLIVENGQDIATWNAANPTIAITHWRIITTVATSNQFGSTTPLRAQVASPTNAPNPPFSRVDFFRGLDATDAVVACGANTYWSYLGSVASTAVIGTDQGTYRSWVYPLTTYANRWNSSTAQGTAAAGDCIIAVGVVSTGDAISTLGTTMVP